MYPTPSLSSNVSYHGVVEQKLEQEKKRSLVEGQPGAPPALPPQHQPQVQPAASQPLPAVAEMPPPSHYPTPQQQNHNGSHRTSVTSASGTSGMQQCKHKSPLVK